MKAKSLKKTVWKNVTPSIPAAVRLGILPAAPVRFTETCADMKRLWRLEAHHDSRLDGRRYAFLSFQTVS
jgi:hypothetical protein